MSAMTSADVEAAVLLIGYHPTHKLSRGSMFCNRCATNVVGLLGKDRCPFAPSEGALRTWDFLGTSRMWTVEERIDHTNGGTYLYCRCPSWKFHGQACKHTAQVVR